MGHSRMLPFAVAAICLAFATTCSCEGFYSIVASNLLRPNSEYHVSVSNLNVPETVQFRITLNNTDSATPIASEEVNLNQGESRLIPFAIGDIAQAEYSLIAEGLSGFIFKNESSLTFQPKSFSVFVQTDKAIYKPGDTVRFRVLVLDPNTKPLQKVGAVKIHITDGKANRIKQWTDAKLVKGVFESELPLSSAPVLGRWLINVEVLGTTKTQEFEVDEYVLPKFEVSVESPGITTFKDGSVKVIVRAKYTYGKPVKGEATVSAYPDFRFHYVQPFERDVITRKTVPIDGKGSVQFDLRSEIKLEGDYTRDIVVEAIVEEELTGRKQNTTAKFTIHDKRYKMELIKNSDKFKPGLPYTAWLKASFQDGRPVQDTTNQIEVTQEYGYPNRTITKRNYTLDENGMAKLVVNTEDGPSYMDFKAVYLGSTFYLGGISKERATGNAYMRAKVLTEVPTINKDLTVDVTATVPMKYFSYQVLGRGDVIVGGTISVPDRKSHTFRFPASFAMVPRARLIVYFVQDDGELISDRVDIEFGNELPNFLKVSLSKTQSKPGEDMDITISTNPDSYVGLLGVDQSVLLLKSGNDITGSKVFDELKMYEQRSYGYGRKKRLATWRFQPTYDDFSNVGALIMTNANEPPRAMYFYQPFSLSGVAYSGASLPGPPLVLFDSPSRSVPKVPEPIKLRKSFPEAWLWENIDEESFSGEKTISKKVPDTITSWIITGFSVSPVHGLGLTQQPRKLNVFLPFFVSTNLPYSVKRGEVVSIPIVIFNYMESDQNAEVTFHNNEQEFQFADVENEVDETAKLELFRKKSVAIPANSGKTVAFMIRPTKLGPITIKVTAVTKMAGDGVERQLLVEPEGLPQYVNKARFVDLRASPETATNFTVDVPKNAVPDSTRIEVAVIGDILGSTIQNLDSLIRMPYGCGEQNMLNFVPNIVVLDYLKNTNQLTSKIETKAKKFMESGYQRELTYKHDDGSFSAFGSSDKSGSTWLTAFVARSFKQAANHISVDENVIDRALEWLGSKQAANGSFPEVGVVSHKDMQGGSGQGIALTAYTLIAFLENKNLIPKYRNVIDKALDYIVRNTEGLEDNYALALAAYALLLAEHSSKDYILAQLDTKATTEGDTKWWHKPIPESDSKNPWYHKPNSVNVEMSSYGLLAFLEADLDTDALPIMKWLIAQRNEKGGFQSTQDTVVGLQALAKLAAKISSKNNDVTIVVTYNENQQREMKVNAENNLILQKFELPSSAKNIDVKATGSGFAVFSLSYKYNMNVTGEWPRFVLDPQVNKNSNQDYLHLSVCTSFVPTTGQNSSNMAVMEVGFPSGFTADTDTLPSLENMDYIKKVELKDDDTIVVLYFDSLDRNELCPTISAFRTHKVAKQKPAPVVIYDYYDNSRIARQFYEGPKSGLCDICEKEDCGDSCTIRSQKQRAARDEDGGRVSTSAAGRFGVVVVFPFAVVGLLLKMFY
ncbi:thioester-containing protein 1 allele R1-like isoform X6 [Toxorhynchites rutilus septentrionalis]|uniref:thioester-containing protein 1 allele R1-like isoform X6 n=1 Tax=Toxorhynchites rutilus septentrionalis TaxID=329112 RepID=UPI00247942A5|nr:thioester-containing protein 1 allele R1-like isoform X6 [Toxorhynchites rutilus septentrionalis]